MKKIKIPNKINVRWSADLGQRLNALAGKLRLSRSQVVRLALEKFVKEGKEERPYEKVKHLMGAIDSGLPDLGIAHHEHLRIKLREKHMREDIGWAIKMKKTRKNK